MGADLSVARLLHAYETGLFPWYEEGGPRLWWSPDPRCVMTTERLHVARRLQRTLRRSLAGGGGGESGLRLTWNQAFVDVMLACAERDEGSWIFPEMLQAYTGLFEAGCAHSLEVWRGSLLVGGLYGVQRGALFAAESMFHRETDMSKVALVVALRSLWRAGVRLFDVQMMTPHLASLGAFELSRREYLERLQGVISEPVRLDSLELDWRPS